MPSACRKLYWFNWPAHVGGSDTKFVHTLRLLAGEYDITVVPNNAGYLQDREWLDYLRGLGVKWCLPEEIPDRAEGWAISLCNGWFFTGGMLGGCVRRGLRVIWSSEMMWHFYGELGAVRYGLVEKVLYVSPVQRQALEPGYRWAASGMPGPPPGSFALPSGGPLPPGHEWWGTLPGGPGGREVPWITAGNYIDPAAFPFRQRGLPKEGGLPFTVGRVSRPDPDKFPLDFPLSYERLDLRKPARFRVLGWSQQMAGCWADHSFDARWDLVPAGSVPVAPFLDSLDIMVYDLGPKFRESWGRSVVEGMLSGVVPLVPRGGGHHLDQLVPHGLGGFLCDGPEDYRRYARQLQDDPALLARLSQGARKWAVKNLCGQKAHLERWHRVFSD
ncbi:MAG: glycosyltransferase family 1 protein [Verrucomicrobiaceae bacterium]|nr:MAG: glycosyltransferase family 1 protein [Verrucomicrobiaceae bacterium]